MDYEVVPSGPFNGMAIVLVGEERGSPITSSKAPVITVPMLASYPSCKRKSFFSLPRYEAICMCACLKSIRTDYFWLEFQ